MKKSLLFQLLCGVLGLAVSTAHCQTVLLNSWENSLEGWSILETSTWTSNGFVTTNGATQGSYSWRLTATAVDYGPTLQGPSSTNLTLLMANAAQVNMEIVVDPTAPHFNWGIQIDVEVNQPGGAGTISVAGYTYPGGVFGDQLTDRSTNTLTWPVSQACRTALNAYPHLPCYLTISVGGGGGGTIYIDNLRATKIPQVQGSLWVRELWDGLGSDKLPANVGVSNLTSSVGFSTDPWAVNPAQIANGTLMAFRTLGYDEPTAGAAKMGLPTTLDGTFGSMIQENSGFGFFPAAGGKTFWTDGNFMTRLLDPSCFINFQATGEYWFSMTIANRPWDGSSGSLYSQYVTFPSSGWGGIGFANGNTTNADFVALGVTGLNVWLGPTNTSPYHGDTNASKALYISQGTLGQPGDPNTALFNPLVDPSAVPLDVPPYAPPYNERYSQTNFSGGPYHINAFGAQTVGHVSGDYIVLLGRLKTFGNGTATLDAKYYGVGVGGNPWNTELDTNPGTITWDCSYSFNFGGTMTRMLLFENGQFPFYMYGFRASTNFSTAVGLDPGRIAVAPLANTFVGYPINLTNLAVEANSYSFASPPSGYGTLTYQWYKNGVAIGGETSQNLNIASAVLTNAGAYGCVATDPSGTWGSVSNAVVITVTQLDPPKVASLDVFHNAQSFRVTFDEPNLTGVDATNHYIFSGGIVATNVTVMNTPTTTTAFIVTTGLPLGTKLTLSISGVTNVVGGTLAATNITFWTDLIQPGVANLDAWLYPAITSANDYFNNFVPANPTPPILQSASSTSWTAPVGGITIVGNNGFSGDGFGDKFYGWFVPPVTTNYVFYIACDDGARLSLSTNESPANLRVIACESLWSDGNQWTNVNDQFPGPGTPHRGDGTANGAGAPAGYVWDNSVAGQSPATACLQNRSDQFIVAYYDSTGEAGGPPGATNQANWLAAASQVSACVPPGMTNRFWPNLDANGQALITLQAGKKYYIELEHVEIGGGQAATVTYKIAGTPDPLSPSTTVMSGAVIAGTVPFTPTISIAKTGGVPVITYTGVLLSGTNLSSITNVVDQSSASTAISLGGPSQHTPPNTSISRYYRTSR